MAEQEWIPVPRDMDNSPELDALPSGTVLFDGDEDVVIKDPTGVWRYWGSDYAQDEPEAVICLPALVIRKPKPPKPNLIRVRRARTSAGRDHHNWIVEDHRGPKVFIRQFTFSYFSAAIKNADRLARTGLIDPRACFGVERIEYPPESPCG